jgi:hypothetical protein
LVFSLGFALHPNYRSTFCKEQKTPTHAGSGRKGFLSFLLLGIMVRLTVCAAISRVFSDQPLTASYKRKQNLRAVWQLHIKAAFPLITLIEHSSFKDFRQCSSLLFVSETYLVV